MGEGAEAARTAAANEHTKPRPRRAHTLRRGQIARIQMGGRGYRGEGDNTQIVCFVAHRNKDGRRALWVGTLSVLAAERRSTGWRETCRIGGSLTLDRANWAHKRARQPADAVRPLVGRHRRRLVVGNLPTTSPRFPHAPLLRQHLSVSRRAWTRQRPARFSVPSAPVVSVAWRARSVGE